MDVPSSTQLHGIKIRVPFRANRLSRDERVATRDRELSVTEKRIKESENGGRWEIKGKDREEIITKPSEKDTGINIWQGYLGRRKLISPVQLTCWSSCSSWIDRMISSRKNRGKRSLFLFNLEKFESVRWIVLNRQGYRILSEHKITD